MDPFCYLCFVPVMMNCLFIAALWSSARKGRTSWLSCFWYYFVFCHFSMWCPGSGVVLDLSIPDLCLLSYIDEQLDTGHTINGSFIGLNITQRRYFINFFCSFFVVRLCDGSDLNTYPLMRW